MFLSTYQKVLERVKLKASTYGQDPNAPTTASDDKDWKVNPQLISDLYRDFVMPLTKEVQVQYLLQRVAHPSIAVAGVEGSFCWMAAQAHFEARRFRRTSCCRPNPSARSSTMSTRTVRPMVSSLSRTRAWV